MSEPPTPISPTGIKLHRKSRLLEIAFAAGRRFLYPCEYLRVAAPAAPGQETPVLGKRREGWQEAFAADRVRVTVNRHFTGPYTRIEHGDEVAIVPRAAQR